MISNFDRRGTDHNYSPTRKRATAGWDILEFWNSPDFTKIQKVSHGDRFAIMPGKRDSAQHK